MEERFVRITYRNTKGKPGFVTVPYSMESVTIQRLVGKGYTMVTANPPYVVKSSVRKG